MGVNIRVCKTCDGTGTKTTHQNVVKDGVKQFVTKAVPCPARCNNGKIDIRSV